MPSSGSEWKQVEGVKQFQAVCLCEWIHIELLKEHI